MRVTTHCVNGYNFGLPDESISTRGCTLLDPYLTLVQLPCSHEQERLRIWSKPLAPSSPSSPAGGSVPGWQKLVGKSILVKMQGSRQCFS